MKTEIKELKIVVEKMINANLRVLDLALERKKVEEQNKFFKEIGMEQLI